ncbi:MAG: UxaA family hydrolase, partial [Treponema sp.]|nr:UxaA family hydrolase [Treponema sp.]
GHKIALKDLKKGDAVIRYGVVLGSLLQDIQAGGHIDEHVLKMPEPPDLDRMAWGKFPAASQWPIPLPDGLPDSFEGYEVPGNQFAGTRNILGIMPTVQCVVGVLDVAAEKIRTELLPKYPNVDGVTVLKHNYGCGCTIESPDAEIPIRTLRNLLRNPNFGGQIMVIALGCEKLTPDMLLQPHENNSDNVIVAQKVSGFNAMLDAVLRMAETKLQKLNERRRTRLPLEKLCIGIQCGGSDAFSGITANPATGYASDLLVSAGGTVMFPEITEARDGVQFISERCISREVSQKLAREMRWYDAYLERGGASTNSNPSPGNKAGGLSNIMEKTMGALAKSGSAPIAGILSAGELAVDKGLLFTATPASDFHCGTLMLASGTALQVFTTGRGTPYGLAAAPVVKVSTRTELKKLWNDIIDIDAGTIIEGEESIRDVGQRLFKMIVDTASGRYKPFAEKNRVYNELCVFDVAPIN